MKNYKSRTQRQREFTLIELLVVVSIIAILAGLLLPSLRNAQYQARLTSVANNIRGMSQAVMAYQQDNGGVFPRVAEAGSSDGIGNATLALLAISQRLPEELFLHPLSQNPSLLSDGGTVDSWDGTTTDTLTSSSYGYNINASLSMRSALIGDDPQLHTLKAGAVLGYDDGSVSFRAKTHKRYIETFGDEDTFSETTVLRK